ncbi:LOW QUALITY PROTEIN: hypothetical protein M514_27621 [Trichuris suis]|uniref:Transposase n=1 Tax=Trichuris suis TaxID=68888 RepID=A0A085MSK9_9BILA|nr:LOW QUALITY PROTEIN: hypothetical protein M514_27621 [Trichuris suis]
MGKMGLWAPLQLSRDDKIQRVSAAGSLLARYRQAVAQRRPFISQIITGDEKWCLYVSMKQRKEWLSPGKGPTPRAKPKLHERKTMLSVWWDCEGVIHFELLNVAIGGKVERST